MNDLFTSDRALPIKLPDADMVLYANQDWGMPTAALQHQLIAATPWRSESITLFGKTYPQPRLIAWYADPELDYSYSGTRLETLPWTPLLIDLKQRVEQLTGHGFNSVLLNYYRDGADSMGMHADDEPELGPQPVIASLSLGESRIFKLRHKREPLSHRLNLEDGSLLLMQGPTQANWKHGIDKTRKPCGPRLNLTFRRVLAAS